MNKVRFGGNLGLIWCLGYAVKWGNAEMAKMHEHEQVADSNSSHCFCQTAKQVIASGVARQYAPADGSSTPADLSPSVDRSAVCTPLAASGG